MIKKAKRYHSKEGVTGLATHAVPYLYRTAIRPRLPSKGWAKWNGVVVPRRKRWGDGVLRQPYVGESRDRPHYEYGFVKLITKSVQRGDNVVLVGGGAGVSTVHAARLAGPDGHVTTYEGGKENARMVEQTARLNDVDERVAVRHGIVEADEGAKLKSAAKEAIHITADELGEMDLLLMDCEGAEQNILQNLTSPPDRVVVETHGGLGYPTEETVSILIDSGYTIGRKVPAHWEEYGTGVESDVYAVSAHQ